MVDVELADVDVLIDSKRVFEGSNIIFNPTECDFDCSMKDQCFPEGLLKKDRCKIIENIGKPAFKCPKGLDLCLVRLKL